MIVPGLAVTVVCAVLTAAGTVKAVKVSGEATPVACTSWMLSVGVVTVPSVQLVVAIPLAFVVELGFLGGRARLGDHDILSLVTFD